MSEETTLTVAQNATGSWDIQALDSDGVAVVMLITDTLSAVVWSGADTEALTTLTAAWVNATAGQCRVSITATQSAALDPGVYPLALTAVRGTQRLPILSAWLEVTASPGTADPPPTYGSYRDMVTYGGGEWLEGLRRTAGGANFADERGRARSYLDSLIVRKWRPWSNTKTWSGVASSGPLDVRNPTLQGYLDDDGLVITDDIRELVALKALELVCRQQVVLGNDEAMQHRAAYFSALCRNKVLTTAAEIDTNDDGIAEYAIPLNVTSLR